MIKTRLQPRFKYWTLAYAVLCLVFGIWGAYDYWVTIPQREGAVASYTMVSQRKAELEAKSLSRPLSEAEIQEFEQLKRMLAEVTTPPTPPGWWDRPLQLWAYVIGCGVLGFPWCTWTLVKASRKSWQLFGDGSLAAPEGTFRAEDLTDIDMSRWMSKSTATVATADGKALLLDDYKYKNTDRIVAALAARFHPGEWTDEPRPVDRDDEEDESSDEGTAPESA